MGCACVKPAGRKSSPVPYAESTGTGTDKFVGSSFREPSGLIEFAKTIGVGEDSESFRSRDLRKLRKGSCNESSAVGIRLGLSRRFMDAEYTAAGWPSWLTTVAAEAIQGWIPLNADYFQKLEKIGQGTYSCVFRAKEIETGRMVAIKKVRFDNFQPESIRFMSREIAILRQLDHPNIIKLEGIITSPSSCSVQLVFEYMEHDLTGLISSSDINFTEAQIKCYMKQLLLGVEHCHLRGIIHRDIKTSNILVSNKGVLKLGDFGLANMASSKQLTSRVVTLWYRPPELLMGSSNYGVSVDLWSVGCVFAELLLRKPLIKGKSEIEQLHKIFKLCGSPPEEFWRRSKPQVAIFRPQHVYESCLRERCKGFQPSSMNLLETFLSVEPYKRGTASSALTSEYFNTLPYACEPSSLPEYHPTKEIDAKIREEAARKKARSRHRETETVKKTTRPCKVLHKQNSFRKSVPKEVVNNKRIASKYGTLERNGKGGSSYKERRKPSMDAVVIPEMLEVTSSSPQLPASGPIPVTSSTGFARAKRQRDNVTLRRSCSKLSIRSQVSAVDSSSCIMFSPKGQDGISRREYHINSFDAADLYCPQDFSVEVNQRGQLDIMGCGGDRDHFDLSDPVLSQNMEDLLPKNENHIRQVARRSRVDRPKGR